ncbi:Uncharacterised protein [Halioglobus japonicus]|nr:Uncharacterised protein [Halioglobus japonicus]
MSLAAGVVQEFPSDDVVRAAARAGFNATGIWFDDQTWNTHSTRRVEEALSETGICPLDLEVVWLKPGEPPDTHDRMIDIGLELGVRNILCVSSEPDIKRTKQRFEYLCRRAEGSGTRIVLEFLAITNITSLQQALDVVQDVAHPAGGILVDALHLHRTGGSANDLCGIEPRLMPYLQLCDAKAQPHDSSTAGLIEDALYRRLLPGDGELPLNDILRQLEPQLPLSLEIRSRELIQQSPDDPLARAQIVFAAAQNFLHTTAP